MHIQKCSKTLQSKAYSIDSAFSFHCRLLVFLVVLLMQLFFFEDIKNFVMHVSFWDNQISYISQVFIMQACKICISLDYGQHLSIRVHQYIMTIFLIFHFSNDVILLYCIVWPSHSSSHAYTRIHIRQWVFISDIYLKVSLCNVHSSQLC